ITVRSLENQLVRLTLKAYSLSSKWKMARLIKYSKVSKVLITTEEAYVLKFRVKEDLTEDHQTAVAVVVDLQTEILEADVEIEEIVVDRTAEVVSATSPENVENRKVDINKKEAVQTNSLFFFF